MRHLIFREAMQSTTLGHAIGSFCVRLLSMSCQIVVCFNRKGSFISIINTRYASNATSERGTQTGIDPATFESKVKSRNFGQSQAKQSQFLPCKMRVQILLPLPISIQYLWRKDSSVRWILCSVFWHPNSLKTSSKDNSWLKRMRTIGVCRSVFHDNLIGHITYAIIHSKHLTIISRQIC